MTTGGTGGKPKPAVIEKNIFDDAPPPKPAEVRAQYIAPEPEPAFEAPTVPDGYDVLEGRFVEVFDKYPPVKNNMELRFRKRNGGLDLQEFAIPPDKMIVLTPFDVENKRGNINCIFAVERKTLNKLLAKDNLQPGNGYGLTLLYYTPPNDAPQYVAPEPKAKSIIPLESYYPHALLLDDLVPDGELLPVPFGYTAFRVGANMQAFYDKIKVSFLFIPRTAKGNVQYLTTKIPIDNIAILGRDEVAYGNNVRKKRAMFVIAIKNSEKLIEELQHYEDRENALVVNYKEPRTDGLSGKTWARFDFRTNDEMREFTEKIERLNWGDSPPRFQFEQPKTAPETPAMFTPEAGARTSDVWLLPVSGVKTDTARFQNRKSEFSEASVERIVNDFDENKLDPIVVWRDPENMRTYVLSGHSRLEAHKRLGKDKIKARFFEGTESEAIRFAKVDANRAATAETVVEDIEAFRLDRDGNANVAPLKKSELKAKWKDKANKLDAYSRLSPVGQFIKTLSQPDLSQWPGIVNKAMWAGELRAMYPHLTDAHEDELFNYMFKTGGSAEKMLKMTKEDLFVKVNDRANSIRFDTDEPLALTKVSTGYEARADTGPALARLKEIRKRLAQIDELSKATESKTARAELANEKATLQREAEFIDKDIDFLKSSQNALFGIDAIMQRWEALGYV